jgi:ubiquinone biosynthesis accessory factor UbiJ
MPARFERSHSMAEDRKRNPLLDILGRALETALNRGLALDSEAGSLLAGLEGRRIGIEFRDVNLALAVGVHEGRLQIGPHWDAASDLNLHATPGNLLAFALRRSDDSPPQGRSPTVVGKVDISGDAELARRVERLLRGFRPDIEEAFAQTFGDVLGVPLARAVQGAFAWAHESAQALAQDSVDFLRDDTHDLVATAELDRFADDVDALRERADRLSARVARASATRTRLDDA